MTSVTSDATPTPHPDEDRPIAAAIETPTAADLPAIRALHERAFGPGRFALTAYRIREGTPPISAFCRIARVAETLGAAVRLTEVTIGGRTGALLLGPLAVAPHYVNRGLGRQLIATSASAARKAGRRLIVLVGDHAYYGRLGFERVTPGKIGFPGPVDPARILALELEPGALDDYTGLVAAAPGVLGAPEHVRV